MSPLPRAHSPQPGAASGPPAPELLALFRDTIALFHCLQATSAAMHGPLSAGLRGVLFGLAQGGPQSVPHMARLRPTSRQHIQVLVNRLWELGLVEFAENPDHRRSKLVRLTPDGERAVQSMQEREQSMLERAEISLTAAEIGAAAATLREVRAALMAPEFRRVVADADPRQRENSDA